MLTYLTFDSLFSFIAAVAKDSQSAQVTALPFLLLFVIYNGYAITKAACPVFMRWAIQISPAAYSIEAIAIAMEQQTSGAEQQQWKQVNQLYSFEHNTTLAIAVMASLCLVFRLAQVVCLQKLNK